METLIQDINHGFLYTHTGQLQTEICQVRDETDNDWHHKMRQTIKDNRMEFCYNTIYLRHIRLAAKCTASSIIIQQKLYGLNLLFQPAMLLGKVDGLGPPGPCKPEPYSTVFLDAD